MNQSPAALQRREVGEWTLHTERVYASPFADVAVTGRFTAPSGRVTTIPGFYAGNGDWRVRFSPDEVGRWSYALAAHPANPELVASGEFEVEPSDARGYLRATPGDAWGFRMESGEAVFLLGDTDYNLFGAAHCGLDAVSYLRRRRDQGFTFIRVRLPVSPFHPADWYSEWQTRRTWPWGGSEQSPRFDLMNLDYFRTVDQVVAEAERIGIGFEMIMEAWGFEFPFNSRQIFTPEWEELWLRYLIARYDAYSCVHFWTPLNEYEYYPNGDWHHKRISDRWAMRIARWIKGVAQHGHIVSMHNGPWMPPFAERFEADPDAVDCIMFQYWGNTEPGHDWLAARIDEQIPVSFKGWTGSAVLAEYGYESNPALMTPARARLEFDAEHIRRGAWRGAMSGLCVCDGFANTWGPAQILDVDQPGVAQLALVKRFFTEVVPFERLRPGGVEVSGDSEGEGRRPLAMSSAEGDLVVVYLPVGGMVEVGVGAGPWRGSWFDPRTGALRAADLTSAGDRVRAAAPDGYERLDHPWDWTLVLRAGPG